MRELWGSERWTDLPKVFQLITGQAQSGLQDTEFSFHLTFYTISQPIYKSWVLDLQKS